MGRVRLSGPARARAGFLAGCAIVSAGVWIIAGLGWALVCAGVALAYLFAFLYDVDQPEKPALESTLRPRPVQDWSEQP